MKYRSKFGETELFSGSQIERLSSYFELRLQLIYVQNTKKNRLIDSTFIVLT